MRLLVDTHVLLWWVGGDQRLTPDVRSTSADRSNAVSVSAVTAAEIGIRRCLGRLTAPPTAAVLEQSGFEELPLLSSHVLALEELPLLHRDPFDRMLIAQALVEGLVLVTVDSRVRAYDVPVLPRR